MSTSEVNANAGGTRRRDRGRLDVEEDGDDLGERVDEPEVAPEVAPGHGLATRRPPNRRIARRSRER